jgi:hypothetical protein
MFRHRATPKYEYRCQVSNLHRLPCRMPNAGCQCTQETLLGQKKTNILKKIFGVNCEYEILKWTSIHNYLNSKLDQAKDVSPI